MTVILLGCYRKDPRTHTCTHTHGWQAPRPLCISSGEDLHSAPGRSTDKLPRQRRETEALAAGRDSAQKASSRPVLSEEPASHLASTGPAYGGGQARTIFWRPEGLAAMAGPSLPGARRGSEASVPLELALGPQPRGYRSQISPRFPQSKMPTRGNWSKVLLSALNNSPHEISSHRWTI